MTKNRRIRTEPPAAVAESGADEKKLRFGRHLHNLMVERGWSQSDFCRRVFGDDEKRYIVSKWLRGVAFPDSRNMAAIAKGLGIEPAELLPIDMRITESSEGIGFELREIPDQPGMSLLIVRKIIPTSVGVAAIKKISELDDLIKPRSRKKKEK